MYISVKEAADLSGKSITTIYRLCAKRKNTEYVKREDNRYLIDKDYLLATYPKFEEAGLEVKNTTNQVDLEQNIEKESDKVNDSIDDKKEAIEKTNPNLVSAYDILEFDNSANKYSGINNESVQSDESNKSESTTEAVKENEPTINNEENIDNEHFTIEDREQVEQNVVEWELESNKNNADDQEENNNEDVEDNIELQVNSKLPVTLENNEEYDTTYLKQLLSKDVIWGLSIGLSSIIAFVYLLYVLGQ